MKIWNLHPLLSAVMPFQLAYDEILFRGMEKKIARGSTNPNLRFYFSSEEWMTAGYSQSQDTAGDGKTPLSRRLTGGGLVRHGKDLIFSLVALKDHDESFSSVRMSYLKIHDAVKAAFEAIHMPLRFFRCDEKLRQGKDCFKYPIATDLGMGKEKIAGGAQKRSSGALLHQESVKIPKKIEANDLIPFICKGFEDVFKIELRPFYLRPDLLQRASRLAEEKYAGNIEPADFNGISRQELEGAACGMLNEKGRQ